MSKPSLIVLSTAATDTLQKKVSLSGLSKKRVETKATFDRKWLQDPDQFRVKGAIGKKRLKETKKKIDSWALDHVLDLGCGHGDLALYCFEKKLKVQACEVSKNALAHLSKLKELNIPIVIDQLPFTNFEDRKFKTLLCTETIGELPAREYRLTFSELARLLDVDGVLICSSSFDRSTYLPHLSFLKMAQTEFKTLDIQYSYHYLFEELLKILDRFKFLKKVAHFFRNSTPLMTLFETLSKIFLGEHGITQIIYVGSKKPLL